MNRYSLTHVADDVLLCELKAFNTQDRAATIGLLVRLAEVEVRKLYAPAAHSSMYSYCIREMHMSEDIALKRLRAARAARRFPAIYAGLADGRLHLSGVALLARHLKKDNWRDLLTAAVHKTKAEIERMLAQRFPQPDVPTRVQAVAPVVAPMPLEPAAALPALGPAENSPAPGPVNSFALDAQASELEVPSPAMYTRVTPLSPGKFAWQLTVDQETQDQLVYVQALLGHTVPTGDVPTLLKRALNLMAQHLERRKFARCVRSRPRRGVPQGRYVPAEVRRAVWQRDGGQCTFVGNGCKRCESTSRLEFDHAEPVAKGGQSTVSNLRLRCRAHNQYAADCTFGAGFMHQKRQATQRRAARVETRTRSEAAAKPAMDPEVIPWLRQLGFSAAEANRGAALCASNAEAPLEQRVRIALRGLAPNCVRGVAPMAIRAT